MHKAPKSRPELQVALFEVIETVEVFELVEVSTHS